MALASVSVFDVPRRMLNATLDGELDNVEYTTDPIFGFQVPKTCPDIPDGVMNPPSSWSSREAYTKRYRGLASRFIDNFKKFTAVSTDSPTVKTVMEGLEKFGPHV